MRNVFFSILFLIFASVFSVRAQDNFRGIIPLITTRAEVEKKFGMPNEYGSYEFEEGTVDLFYSENACLTTNKSCFCLIPIGTVMRVTLYPAKDIRIEDLKLDPKLFEKSDVVGGCVEGITVYINEKKGIDYYVRGGMVRHIDYTGSEETCEILKKKDSEKEDKQ